MTFFSLLFASQSFVDPWSWKQEFDDFFLYYYLFLVFFTVYFLHFLLPENPDTHHVTHFPSEITTISVGGGKVGRFHKHLNLISKNISIPVCGGSIGPPYGSVDL